MPVLFGDDEKRRWAEMVHEDLAQQPTWGLHVRRRYERELSSLAGVEAALKR